MVESGRLLDMDLCDVNGARIGSIESAWVDEETRDLEFLGVRTGLVGERVHVIPAQDLRVDEENKEVRAPFAAQLIEDAPSFEPAQDLSMEQEARVCEYFGARLRERAARREPGARAPTTAREPSQRNEAEMSPEDVTIPLAEEELEVGKRRVSAGGVRLHKIVRTERKEIPIELQREEIHIERLPPSGKEVPPSAFKEEDVIMTATREEPVIGKRVRPTGEVHAYKTQETRHGVASGEVRKTEVEAERLDEERER